MTTAAEIDEGAAEIAAKAYADATDYYVPFHRGLKSESSDKIRKGVKAAIRAYLAALPAPASGGAFVNRDGPCGPWDAGAYEVPAPASGGAVAAVADPRDALDEAADEAWERHKKARRDQNAEIRRLRGLMLEARTMLMQGCRGPATLIHAIYHKLTLPGFPEPPELDPSDRLGIGGL